MWPYGTKLVSLVTRVKGANDDAKRIHFGDRFDEGEGGISIKLDFCELQHNINARCDVNEVFLTPGTEAMISKGGADNQEIKSKMASRGCVRNQSLENTGGPKSA